MVNLITVNSFAVYNADVIRQFACLMVNLITVNSFAVLFNCMPMGRDLDSMIIAREPLVETTAPR